MFLDMLDLKVENKTKNLKKKNCFDNVVSDLSVKLLRKI